ncbi:ABC transporter permease [Pararhizobium arenae]|uniref:ABC transporter permease n=1 Tax=Pararhizobium arenae TaxID=1856850 RepID=UPI00094B135A|nr:ABC transporter permease [Pararhizobium arenae]
MAPLKVRQRSIFRPVLNALVNMTWAERLGLIGLGVVTIIALVAHWVTPFDPQMRVGPAYLPPGSLHWFGTDEIGRDLFSRVLLGVQVTWLPALGLVLICLVAGTLIGLIPSIVSERLDGVVQRIVDLFLVLPGTLVALAVIASLGPGLTNTMIAIGVAWWPWYARISRDEFRRIRGLPHFEAALLAGVGRLRLTFHHVLPGAFPALIVFATVDVGNVIMTISLLSFLGLGQPAPAPELGIMTSRALDSLSEFWWLPVLPATAIFVICFLSNLAGDGLRAALKGK